MTAIHPFPEQKLLYIEVPKAGCTSIKKVLSVLRKKGGWTPETGISIHQWMGYTFVRSNRLAHVLRHSYDGWTIFTVTRHPFRRFRSLFFDKLLTSMSPDLAQAEFLSSEAQLLAFIEKFSKGYWYRCNHHGRPQTTIIGEDLSLFQYVGKTENMDDVFNFLAKFLPAKPVILHENQSHSDPDWDFPPEAKKRLFALYQKDFEVLDYEPV